MTKENPRTVTIIKKDGSKISGQPMKNITNGDTFLIEGADCDDVTWIAYQDAQVDKDGRWGVSATPDKEPEKGTEYNIEYNNHG